MMFSLPTLLWAFLLGLLTALFGWGHQLWPNAWRVLPRNRVLGAVLGLVCLLWSAWHAQFLLEGDLAKYQPWLWVAVPVVAVVGVLYLDFLFARALGGFILLLMPLLLDQGFTVHLPGRPLFSAACYLFGLAGMVLVAAPWYFRDLLRFTSERAAWRRTASAVTGIAALLFVAFALLR